MKACAGLALSTVLAASALAQEAPCENPVVPAPGEGMSVVQAEHHWLNRMFGGGEPVRQAVAESSDGKRRYDLILWRKPDGQTVDVCFDVTTVFEETIREVEEEESGDSRRPAR
jgi:hypothetical protein